ncbi:MAG TPA: Fe-S cluster assembly protein SufD [Candidatus Thermoplasmatota archaeon]|nr:Fe-S cluster assembly protein SufD [Candidatus Thermoplasmatota archaeon]
MTANTKVATDPEGPLTAFARVEPDLPGEGLRSRRTAALDRFHAQGWPTAKDDAWKRTDISPIRKLAFRPATTTSRVADEVLRRHSFRAAGFAELVLVDGHLAPERSRLDALPAGVHVSGLAEALAKDPSCEGRVGAVAKGADAFGALNEAFFSDGAYVEVDRSTAVPTPIHVLHVQTGGATVSFPRTLVVAGEASEVSVVESYVSAEAAPYLTGAVTEIAAADGAVVHHHRLQRESEQAHHVHQLHTLQGRSSSVVSRVLSLGGAIVRNEVSSVFAGEGGELLLDGLFVAHGTQHMDNHTRIDHAVPRCSSRELYKGILDGKSRGVFDGLILVRKDAQKTDAKQTNKNLLLSDEALVDSNPQLEIFADDVKCTHGSTIGQLDEEAMFYMRARGIGPAAAKSMLTYAFATDVTSRVKIPALRERVDALVVERLPEAKAVEVFA